VTESQFIAQNKDKWRELEIALKEDDHDPDHLIALYRKVSSDLSYAQTYYPRRMVRKYLNDLVNGVFLKVKTRPSTNLWQMVKRFYTQSLPTEIIRHYKAFIMSFLVFGIAVLIGVVTNLEEPSFVNEILGPEYVHMTEQNIAKNDPMSVYKDSKKSSMFLGITFNNIKVAIFCFVSGIFTSLGTLYALIRNGIMLGAFQSFFYQKGLLLTSMLTIWIHGTIEISAIIIAGAAGIILGNSLMFPGTFTRIQSLKIGALRSIVIILSTIPLFVIAGFLESFVTRLTEWPDIAKMAVIGISLLLILTIYVIIPIRYYRKGRYISDTVPLIPLMTTFDAKISEVSFVKKGLQTYIKQIETWIKVWIMPMAIIAIVVGYYLSTQEHLINTVNEYGMVEYSFPLISNRLMLLYLVALIHFFTCAYLMINNIEINRTNYFETLSSYFLVFFVGAVILLLPFLSNNTYITICIMLIIPSLSGFAFLSNINTKSGAIDMVKRGMSIVYKYWLDCSLLLLGLFIMVVVLFWFGSLINETFLKNILQFLNIWEFEENYRAIFNSFIIIFGMILLLPFTFYRIEKLNIMRNSSDLVEKIQNFPVYS
jgi:uncharacterized membrane protein SpoIIM required for sporulation